MTEAAGACWPIVDFDIRVEDPDGNDLARWARGSRLRLEERVFRGSQALEHPLLGRTQATGEARRLARRRLCEHGVVHVEVDLQPLHGTGAIELPPDILALHREFITGVTGWAVDENLADACADALLTPPTGPISSNPPDIAPELVAAGWAACDLWLLTSLAPKTDPNHTAWCLRGARLLYGPPGLLVVWHPLTVDREWRYRSGYSLVIPLPECRRRHSMLADVIGQDGETHAARLMQDACQHHEWTSWQLTQRVETWERDFFKTARAGGFFEGFDLTNLSIRLDDVHQLLAQLRRITRDYDRRARLGWLPNPEVVAREEGMDTFGAEMRARAQQIHARVETLNASLREGWTLLASAASGAQVELQRSQQDFQQRFQNAATLTAALVLVPGLVVSLYGADVTGLPGMRKTEGIAAIGLYALLGALVTMAALRAVQAGRKTRAWGVMGIGALALTLLTLVLA